MPRERGGQFKGMGHACTCGTQILFTPNSTRTVNTYAWGDRTKTELWGCSVVRKLCLGRKNEPVFLAPRSIACMHAGRQAGKHGGGVGEKVVTLTRPSSLTWPGLVRYSSNVSGFSSAIQMIQTGMEIKRPSLSLNERMNE